jgi:hypothetical protein
MDVSMDVDVSMDSLFYAHDKCAKCDTVTLWELLF